MAMVKPWAATTGERAFMDGLWLLGSDELADSSSLTHSPVLRASLVPLEDGVP